MVLLLALARAVVAIGCWIGYQLIPQNGRILLHLETLQQQIAELKLRSEQSAPAVPLRCRPGSTLDGQLLLSSCLICPVSRTVCRSGGAAGSC